MAHPETETSGRMQALLAEAGRRLLDLVRSQAHKRIGDYQRQTNWTRWRLWVVVAYTLVAIPSLATLLPERNPLDAYLRIKKVDLHAARVDEPFFVFLRNDSQEPWKNVRVTLNRKYVYERVELKAGDAISIELDRFLKNGAPPTAKDSRPPANVHPEQIVVSSDAGKSVFHHPAEERD